MKQYTAIAKKPTENLLQRELKYFNTKKINYIDPQKNPCIVASRPPKHLFGVRIALSRHDSKISNIYIYI